MKVIDALFSAGKDELDLVAALTPFPRKATPSWFP